MVVGRNTGYAVYSASSKLGNANPALYKIGDTSGAIHDITSGNNGAYRAVTP